MPDLTLISHHLCPYVQRAAIALTEKQVTFDRISVDLSDKPDWFMALSPLGKTPVLKVDSTAIFESAVILEYLEETQPKPLHPTNALRRAAHRGWIEFCLSILNDIANLYLAKEAYAFSTKTTALEYKFDRLEQQHSGDPWFDRTGFSLVDVVYGPVFRYFDAFDRISSFGVLANKPSIARWRQALAFRPSVSAAVDSDFDERLWAFLKARGSFLSQLMPS